MVFFLGRIVLIFYKTECYLTNQWVGVIGGEFGLNFIEKRSGHFISECLGFF